MINSFYLVGDSITQGSNDPNGFSFASALQSSYARKLDVCFQNFFPTPEQARVRLLLIFFGANDLSRGSFMNQYVPLDQYTENLKKIISHPLVKAHNPRVILVTPAPVDEATCKDTNIEWGVSDEPRRVKDTRDYRDAVKKIGEDENLAVVDVWSKFMSACGWNEGDDVAKMPGLEENGKDEMLRKFLYDGLHFSGDGYKILFEEVTKCIAGRFPDQTPDKLDNVLKMQWERDLGW
ncbi:hypothetical protein DID88_002046 [Monilinia fructigena]|uniref:Uncharacterized protein n=1 Tax=Monilinia fructigena TaxID=38457 RepID=A0A395IXL4_9HELO|nr:hypothetical protein DID88_002046 [Monilinia fructigena]